MQCSSVLHLDQSVRKKRSKDWCWCFILVTLVFLLQLKQSTLDPGTMLSLHTSLHLQHEVLLNVSFNLICYE